MDCITRYEMYFGDIIVPPRTECKIISPNLSFYDANCIGANVNIAIGNHIIDKMDVENTNVVKKGYNKVNDSTLYGILVRTKTTAICINASFNEEFWGTFLKSWKLKKIFDNTEYMNHFMKRNDYKKMFTLGDVVEYFEELLADWVQENCDFRLVTEEIVENEWLPDGFGIGDSILTHGGLAAFEEKKRELQSRLETIGFTYNFKGGLIWE